jgi:Na+/H+ antiporter NhaA
MRQPLSAGVTRVRLLNPLAAFLKAETSGALVLLLATVAALLWANSRWGDAYEALWRIELGIGLGEAGRIGFDLRHLVNDGLMTLFFLVVGLEIKRELAVGELADRRKAMLPFVAAVGGMIVPAAVYAAMNAGGPGERGWGIPVATDIAFALGVLALLGRGLPGALRIFLLSLAITDDIGSIVVIAIFYSDSLEPGALLGALALLSLVVLLWRTPRGLWRPVLIALSMGATWVAVVVSGVHPTIAGVALGLIAPVDGPAGTSPAERLERALHPWTSYLVIPIFALANAGIRIDPGVLASSVSSPITLGIILGLVAGKLLGVSAGAYIAVRAGIAVLPRGVRWSHIVGVAAVAGIGYTVSLFIADLSFGGTAAAVEAKMGVLFGSAIAAGLAAILLRLPKRAAASPLGRADDREVVQLPDRYVRKRPAM